MLAISLDASSFIQQCRMLRHFSSLLLQKELTRSLTSAVKSVAVRNKLFAAERLVGDPEHVLPKLRDLKNRLIVRAFYSLRRPVLPPRALRAHISAR